MPQTTTRAETTAQVTETEQPATEEAKESEQETETTQPAAESVTETSQATEMVIVENEQTTQSVPDDKGSGEGPKSVSRIGKWGKTAG